MSESIRAALALAGFVGLASAGCGEGTQFVQVPDWEDSTETVIVIRWRASAVELEARSIEDFRRPLMESVDQIERIGLLSYELPLEGLDLLEGPLVRADEASCARRSIPVPEDAFVLRADAIEEGFVSQPDGEAFLQTELPGVELEVECPCTDFDLEMIEVGAHGTTTGIQRLADETWLVVAHRAILVLDDSGRVLSSTVSKDDLWADAAPLGPKRALLAKRDGRLFDWDRGALTQTATLAVNEELQSVATSADGTERYVVENGGRIYGYADGVWTAIYEDPPTRRTMQLASIAWIEPGRITVARRYDYGLLELGYRGQAGVTTTDWSSDVEPVRRIDYVPALGLMLSSRNSRYFFRVSDEDTGWTELAPGEFAQVPVNVDKFLPSGAAGVLMLGRNQVSEYQPRSDLCAPIRLPEELLSREGAIAEDGRVLIGGEVGGAGPDASETRLFMLTSR